MKSYEALIIVAALTCAALAQAQQSPQPPPADVSSARPSLPPVVQAQHSAPSGKVTPPKAATNAPAATAKVGKPSHPATTAKPKAAKPTIVWQDDPSGLRTSVAYKPVKVPYIKSKNGALSPAFKKGGVWHTA